MPINEPFAGADEIDIPHLHHEIDHISVFATCIAGEAVGGRSNGKGGIAIFVAGQPATSGATSRQTESELDRDRTHRDPANAHEVELIAAYTCSLFVGRGRHQIFYVVARDYSTPLSLVDVFRVSSIVQCPVLPILVIQQ